MVDNALPCMPLHGAAACTALSFDFMTVNPSKRTVAAKVIH